MMLTATIDKILGNASIHFKIITKIKIISHFSRILTYKDMKTFCIDVGIIKTGFVVYDSSTSSTIYYGVMPFTSFILYLNKYFSKKNDQIFIYEVNNHAGFNFKTAIRQSEMNGYLKYSYPQHYIELSETKVFYYFWKKKATRKLKKQLTLSLVLKHKDKLTPIVNNHKTNIDDNVADAFLLLHYVLTIAKISLLQQN